jgi:bacterioferritin
MPVPLAPMTKGSEPLKEMLNKAIAREIQVSVQYMWQHIQVVGVKGVAVQDKFKQTAIAEMKHAEKIAERLWYLGGTPTTKPDPIVVGGA